MNANARRISMRAVSVMAGSIPTIWNEAAAQLVQRRIRGWGEAGEGQVRETTIGARARDQQAPVRTVNRSGIPNQKRGRIGPTSRGT